MAKTLNAEQEVKEQLKPWTVKGDIYSIGSMYHTEERRER